MYQQYEFWEKCFVKTQRAFFNEKEKGKKCPTNSGYPCVFGMVKLIQTAMHGRSNRTLDQRQRADSGPKSSSSETSSSFSFSYRHLASTSTGHIGEQIQVARLNSNHNCMSRKHLSKESTGSCYQCKCVFLKRGLA